MISSDKQHTPFFKELRPHEAATLMHARTPRPITNPLPAGNRGMGLRYQGSPFGIRRRERIQSKLVLPTNDCNLDRIALLNNSEVFAMIVEGDCRGYVSGELRGFSLIIPTFHKMTYGCTTVPSCHEMNQRGQ